MTVTIEVCLNRYQGKVSIAYRSLIGIRKGTAWYNSHLSLTRPIIPGQAAPTIPTVVLLTDDVADRQKAEREGIQCLSGKCSMSRRSCRRGMNLSLVRSYVEGMPKATELLDLLSVAGSNDVEPTVASGRTVLYPDVWCSSVPLDCISRHNPLQYLPSGALIAGVKAGQLHQGYFNANQYNYLEVCNF